MPKKAKRKVKRKPARKTAKKVVRKAKRPVVKSSGRKMVRSNQRKIFLVLKNLVAFLALFVLSMILFNVSSNAFFEDLFFFVAIILGFISLAFFIALLVLLFLRAMKK